MSDRDQAIEAGARVMAAQAGFDLDSLARYARPGEDVAAWRANWIKAATEVHGAMEQIIRRQVIQGLERPGSQLCTCDGSDGPPTNPYTGQRMDHHCDCAAVEAARTLLGEGNSVHDGQCDAHRTEPRTNTEEMTA